MVATVGIFVYIGHRIDKARDSEKPWFTLLLSVVGVIVAIYQLFKTFLKN